MNRYSKYFLNHLLWLDDGFCQYYLQNPAWGTEEILDVEAVVFDWPQEAEQWLAQCADHDPVTTLRHLRVFLADHCPEHYNLHRMNDRRVIKAAARQICLNLHRIVIEPRLGWAVQVDPLTQEPTLPVSVEPDSEYSHLLEELQTLLNGLVADQKKRNNEWEAKMVGMNRIERALFIKKQIDDASKEQLVEDAHDAISIFSKLFPAYLKTLWKVTQTPARMGMLTGQALATGNANPLKEEIDKIVTPVARTYEEAQRYKTMLTILLSNPTTHEILWDFAKRYYEASHPIDLGRTGAKAVTEVMLNILLALVSAGAVVALNTAAKTAKLVKVAKLLEKIAFVIKRLGPESKVVNKLGDLLKSEKKAAKAARKAEKLVPDKKHKPPESLDDGPKKEYDKHKGKDGPKTTDIPDKKFKRQHVDGASSDPYTLMPDGKPMGAKEGAMPAEFKGLRRPPADYEELRAEGYPDIAAREDFANFSTIEAKELPPGTKIYRIIDEGSSEMSHGNSGCYWAKELPQNKTAWRSNYAVKDSWNDNGYYVEHTVGPDGLKVWEGKTAGQEYLEHRGKNFYLEGGDTQLYVEYGKLDNLQPKHTNWPDV
jgi:hypothetical protein